MQLFHRLLSHFFLSGCSDYNPLKVRRACRLTKCFILSLINLYLVFFATLLSSKWIGKGANKLISIIWKKPNSKSERYPVNGIHNKETVYQDITQDFCEKELSVLQTYLQELPSFRIARVGLRANSKADLLLEHFLLAASRI
jgi:hypothetical protein